jgi:hypothetical protein
MIIPNLKDIDNISPCYLIPCRDCYFYFIKKNKDGYCKYRFANTLFDRRKVYQRNMFYFMISLLENKKPEEI